MSKQSLFTLAALLITTLGATGCGSKGNYTRYIVGSKIETSESRAIKERASLRLNHIPVNDVQTKPRYDMTLVFDNSGPHHAITLGFVAEGKFEQPNKDKVRLTVSRKESLSVTSGDPVYEALIDHITIGLRFVPKVTYTPRAGFNYGGGVDMSVDYNYEFSLLLYDDQNQLLGEYNETITESTDSGQKPSTEQPYNPDPNSLSSLFRWASAQANKNTLKLK